MAIEMDDEFDYLQEDDSSENTEEEFTPKIKGSSKRSLIPKEDQQKEIIEEKEIEEDITKEEKEEIKKPKKEFKSVIFVVKVTTNKEDKALELIAEKVRKKKIEIYALARPHGLRGYVFLESPDKEHAEEAVTAEIKIEKNDIIEIISEPFKNEKAKVIRIDKTKGDCVVSLLGAAVPIPVTVKLDNIKVISDINTATLEFKGVTVPVHLDIDSKTKKINIKVLSPPTSELIKKELKIEKASSARLKQKVGNLAIEQVVSISKVKHKNMLSNNFTSTVKSVIGTCQALGVLIENKEASEILAEMKEGKYKDIIESEKTQVDPEKRKELDDYFKDILNKQEAMKKAEEAEAAEKEAKKATESVATTTAKVIEKTPAKVIEKAPAKK